MTQVDDITGLLRRALWLLLSVPIRYKVMGICALVAIIFGVATLYQVRQNEANARYEIVKSRAKIIGAFLAEELAWYSAKDEQHEIQQHLQLAEQAYPDICYVVVRDHGGKIFAHYSLNECRDTMPPDLLSPERVGIRVEDEMRVLHHSGKLIVEAIFPIANGRHEVLEVGVTDKFVVTKILSSTTSVLWTLGVCFVIGTGLALAMTTVLVRPIHSLLHATNRIRQGDFDTRAEILAHDETGELAEAFNQMAEDLQNYRHASQQKETTRIALIDRIVLAQEAERKNVARELHDQLGQSLSTLLLMVQTLPRETAPSSERRQELTTLILGLIDDVRNLAWELRPSVLDDFGLDSALCGYVAKMSERMGIPVDCQCTSASQPERFPTRFEVALYRITQEALTNIMRHAHATHASVIFLRSRDEVTLVVEDNGRGFEITDDIHFLGLVGMRERTTLLGGDFTIESTPGKGTSVRVRIPVEVKST